MQGKKHYSEKLFTSFQLSDRVPANNKYRRLKEMLDLGFVRETTSSLYGTTGPPSIDPAVFFKLMIVSYMEGITSDRQLIEHCSLRMDILYFLGYDIDEELPWHSTISRTRQLYPVVLFEKVFNKVFAMCVKIGLVEGSTQSIDSAVSKANASKESLVEIGRIRSFFDKSRQENSEEQSPEVPAKPKKQEKGVNRYKRSKTDPDARLIGRLGKETRLGYHCNVAVDAANHVITHIQPDYGDQRDSDCLKSIVERTEERLNSHNLELEQVIADTNYSSGENYEWLEQKDITGWIPVHGAYQPQREGFTYNEAQDNFSCPNEKQLTLRRSFTDKRGNKYKLYSTSTKDCNGCPLRSACLSSGQSYKSLKTSAYHKNYKQAHQRQQSDKGRKMARLRSSRVEPVLGTLMNDRGLRKLRLRGIENANKVMQMGAAVYNLKKVLDHYRKLRPAMQMGLKKVKEGLIKLQNNLLQSLQHIVAVPSLKSFC